jgi:hypothetical protein
MVSSLPENKVNNGEAAHMGSISDHPDDFDREWAYRRGYAHGVKAGVAALYLKQSVAKRTRGSPVS